MSRSHFKGPFLNKKQTTQIHNKSLVILPIHVNNFYFVYNGKKFIKLKVVDSMIGFRFGEFVNTRIRHIYKKKKK